MVLEAKACRALLSEATKRWPNRSRASDGILPSAAHTATNPSSDHELGNAVDLTHDPANGVDCQKLADFVRFDPRLKYVIFNRRIYNPTVAHAWRPYAPGTTKPGNPHTKHMHVSIKATARDDVSPWFEDPQPIVIPPQEGDTVIVHYRNADDPTQNGDVTLPGDEVWVVDHRRNGCVWVVGTSGAALALGRANFSAVDEVDGEGTVGLVPHVGGREITDVVSVSPDGFHIDAVGVPGYTVPYDNPLPSPDPVVVAQVVSLMKAATTARDTLNNVLT